MIEKLRLLWWRLKGYEPVPEEEIREAQAEARVNIDRAIRRANRLYDRADRLPMGSNGEKKARRDARMIAQGAYDLAVKTDLVEEFFPGSRAA